MANLKYTGEVRMQCPTSRCTRFLNIVISITAFALGLGLIVSSHAQSYRSKADQKEESTSFLE